MDYNAIEELEKIPKDQWARIRCSLNEWEYPKELKHLQPMGWGKGMEFEQASINLIPLIRHIDKTIGHKACLRYHNRERMTDDQFEVFYRAKF